MTPMAVTFLRDELLNTPSLDKEACDALLAFAAAGA